jgi:hypothetical protein
MAGRGVGLRQTAAASASVRLCRVTRGNQAGVPEDGPVVNERRARRPSRDPQARGSAPSRSSSGRGPRSGRAFRGLALVFVLSFLNLVGVLLTATVLGGIAPWSRWQFIGMFGVVEVASGFANVLSPNVWRLPIAELQTSERTDVKLAASTLLLPHWGGLARAAAGLVCMALAAWHEGTAPVTFLLVPFVLALAWLVLALSAVLARAGVAYPELDVLQFVVRLGRKEKELAPISIGASILQFLLSIVTLPIAKLLPPSVLFQPAIGPSASALLLALALFAAATAVAYLVWSDRVVVRASREQQREAEAQS